MTTSKIIMIAGMHRSGTSLTANLLKQSGLFIGNNLMSAGFDNKKGHFEDLEFLNIHESDLSSKGLDTRGLSSIPSYSLEFDSTTIEHVNLAIKTRSNKAQWGWKEPRTTLYLEAWKQHITDIKCIAVYRNFDEVTSSIIRRYNHKLRLGVGLSPTRRLLHRIAFPINYFIKKREAYKAWYIYNSHILAFKKKYPEDIIVLELSHFLQHYNQIVSHINIQFSTVLEPIDISTIYETELLKKDIGAVGWRCFSTTKLVTIEDQLKSLSLWM